MCGRFACTLDGCHYKRACAYKNKAGDLILPKNSYIHDSTASFTTSFNVAPTSITPVIVKGNCEKESECSEDVVERVICDMRWGLIPPWNDSRNITNAKAETILEKGIFKKPFTTGQRCVVAVNGFYEWQAVGTKFKQPYFVYTPSDIKWEDLDYDGLEKYWSSSRGWTGPKLLNMAGIFSPTNSTNPNVPPYSYAVVTIDSQEPFASVHHRVPVILEMQDEIDTWLNNRSPVEEVVSLLKPPTKLEWYTVSDTVGNSRNKDPSCLAKVEPKKTPQKKTPQKKALLPGQTSIMSFFKTSSNQNCEKGSGDYAGAKRTKLDF